MFKEDEIKNGSTPISIRRGITPMALFVCNVDKTKCPVKAACVANSAVSLSLISPTIIMSGSWRKIDLNPEEKVYPISDRIWL